MGNLLRLPARLPAEEQTQLLCGGSCRIERIVSNGHGSPDGFWYDQGEDEWVTILQGEAVLAFEKYTATLRTGDCLLIPAHCRHRVECTSRPCIWLCVFGRLTLPEGGGA